jgi:hypothetical protein
MELYIQIRDGQPFEHPIFGDNFRQAFPHIDVNNLPSEFARFERIDCPRLATMFQVDEVTYQWVDGVVKDVWAVREMTDDEHADKLQQLTDSANASVESLKSMAQTKADNATADDVKQVWLGYLAQLNTWVLNDPVTPQFPRPPSVNADGTLVNLNVQGSEPDVIG